MSTVMATRSLATVKNRAGRVDVLLHGLASLVTKKLEEKTKLVGLHDGLMPIFEDEIKKNVPARTVIPRKYKGLAKMVADRLDKVEFE